MRVIPAIAIGFAMLLLAVCRPSDTDRGRDTSRQGPDPAHTLFGCLEGDSAVYSNVATDSETGDAHGVRIALWQAGDGIDGATAPARDLDHPVPIARVRLTGRDSLLLDMRHETNASDTSSFVGRVACDSLWGQRRPTRTSPPHDVSYRRVR